MPITPKRRWATQSPGIEFLESRALLSAVGSELLTGDVADTLNASTNLGTIVDAEVVGSIDRNGADVDWYAFTLATPATVTFGSSFGVVSLYNNAAHNFTDSLGSIGQRLLLQAEAGSDPASFSRDLAAGTYYVAISGTGNSNFHPLLANSGISGETGDYTLSIETVPLDTLGADPLLLSVEASALGIRINLSEAFNFTPDVRLQTQGGTNIPLSSARSILGGTEWQFTAAAPLAPGHYTLIVKDASQTVRLTVAVDVVALNGAETGTQGNDTPATSIQLGAIQNQGLIQVSGVIGDDPYYNFSTTNPALFAGNDVDLYHFQINSAGTFGLQAEVFAGRIGSNLDAGLTLYRLNPVSGALVYVAGNNQTYNDTEATNGSTPLFSDPVVLAGLTAGDYYLAVSQGWNTVSTLEALSAGNGTYNPQSAHSGSNGTNTGAYVLNLQVLPAGVPPQVVSVSIDNQSSLSTSPTDFTVKFSDFMNLAGPAFASFASGTQSVVSGVFVRDAQGHTFYPRFVGFDPTTFEAQFQMSDRLPDGNYELHLRGSQGVTNALGQQLVGNSAGGDYVVSFSVGQGPVGTGSNPLTWTHDSATDLTNDPQNLGVLFPNELTQGVEVVRTTLPGGMLSGDVTDQYTFTVLTAQHYEFNLTGSNLPAETKISILNSAGNPVPYSTPDGGRLVLARLQPGTYTLQVGGWSASLATGLNYQVRIRNSAKNDDAPSLHSGPAPYIALQLWRPGVTVPGGGTGGSGSIGGLPNPGSGGNIPGNSGSIGGGLNDPTAPAGGATGSSRSNYLSIRTGIPQVDSSGPTGGITIAIPTLGSRLGGSSGSTLRASRTLRQNNFGSNLLRPGSLSEIADDPIGRAKGVRRDVNEAKIAASRMHDLIDSAIARKQDAESKSNLAIDSREEDRPELSQDELETTTDEQAVTDEPSDAESNVSDVESAEKFEENAALLLEAIHVSMNEQHAPRNSGAREVTTDSIFAAGLGLLLSELGFPRGSYAQSLHVPGSKARRTRKQTQRMEDPAS